MLVFFFFYYASVFDFTKYKNFFFSFFFFFYSQAAKEFSIFASFGYSFPLFLWAHHRLEETKKKEKEKKMYLPKRMCPKMLEEHKDNETGIMSFGEQEVESSENLTGYCYYNNKNTLVLSCYLIMLSFHEAHYSC